MQLFYLLFSVDSSAHWTVRGGTLSKTTESNGRCSVVSHYDEYDPGDSLVTENMSTGDGMGGPLAIVRLVADVTT